MEFLKLITRLFIIALAVTGTIIGLTIAGVYIGQQNGYHEGFTNGILAAVECQRKPGCSIILPTDEYGYDIITFKYEE